MDFSALEAYVMVCQEGKMSRAAEKLFISKQALSMAIKRVEGEMGTKLLARTGSGVVMTAEGERFFSYAQRILALWKDCGQELEAMKARQRARLRVGFGYMIWNFWSKDMEDAFSRSYPQIALSVQGERSSSLLRKMDEGQLDLVITCMQSQRYDQYNHKMLLPMDTLVMMAQDDALAGKTVLTPWIWRADAALPR